MLTGKKIWKALCLFFSAFILAACENDLQEVNALSTLR